MTNNKLFGLLSIETAGTLVIVAVCFGMGYQALASDQKHTDEQQDAIWLKVARIEADQIISRVKAAEFKAVVNGHTKTLERIEKQNGEILKYLRGDVYMVRDRG